MKIKHILEHAENKQEKKLVFTHIISQGCDEIFESNESANNWDHIRHITDKLYYAWDNGAEKDGGVFVGEYK